MTYKEYFMVFLSVLFGISGSIFVIIVSWYLATGHQILPDLQRGYNWNVNAVELIVACLFLLVQVIGAGLMFAKSYRARWVG